MTDHDKGESQINRELFLGFIKIHILYHATKDRVYGVELIEELGRHGYRLGPGTLYPTLHKLENADYLECTSEVVNGKVRKYYRATELGVKALEDARCRITELVQEVME